MKKSVSNKFALSVVSSLAFLLLAAGCRQEAPAPDVTPQAVGTFTGQELPEVVEEIEGTPLYSSSEELAGIAPMEGATYLLIAPQDPVNALLVLEEGAAPAEVAQRESKPVKLSGKKETAQAQALVGHVKDRYELDLQVDDAGNVIVLRVSPSAPPAATPAGTASPDQTPQNESTPQGE